MRKIERFSQPALPVRQHRGEEAVGADEGLGIALELHLAVLVQLAQVHRHAGIEDRIELVALGTAKVAPRQILYLLLGIDLSSVQVGLQVVQLVGVGLIGQDRRPVEVRERCADGVGVVQKVQHEHIVLLRVRPVEARQGLHRLDAGQRLVHVHGVQQRLVVTGLELVRAHQEAVGVLLEPAGDLRRRQAVQRRLAQLRAAVLVLPGEGDQGLIAALALGQVVADGVVVLDGTFYPVGHHRCPRRTADLALCQHLVVEVVDHDLGLEPDRVIAALHKPAQLSLRLLDVELRVILHRLGQPVVAGHRRVAGLPRRG